MNSQIHTKSWWQTFAWGVLGLFALRLLTSAILFPFISHRKDDWNYLSTGRYIVDNHDWLFSVDDRPFSTLILVIAHLLFPGRFQAFHYIHILQYCLVAAGMFYLGWRLFPRHGWFAFFYAAVYLVYVPMDQQSPTSWLVMAPWGYLFLIIALIGLLEFYLEEIRPSWQWVGLGISIVMVYLGARIYESIFFLMLPLPFFMWLARRKFQRKQQLGLALWYGSLTIAFLQFLYRLYRFGTGADELPEGVKTISGPKDLVVSSLRYVENSFPIERIFSGTDYRLLLPPLLAAAAFGMSSLYLRRKAPEACTLPPPLYLLGGIAFGAVWAVMGSSAYIAVKFAPAGRPFFYAAPGQTLTVICFLALVAHLLQKPLAVGRFKLLNIFAIWLFITAGQWFYDTQRSWGALPNYDDEVIYMRDLFSAVPDLQDHTLVLLNPCVVNSVYMPWYTSHDLLYVPYLFGEPADTKTQVSLLGQYPFDEGGILIPVTEGRKILTNTYYRYDEMVILTCSNNMLVIQDKFPAEAYGPAGADLSAYNPYARVESWQIIEPANTVIRR